MVELQDFFVVMVVVVDIALTYSLKKRYKIKIFILQKKNQHLFTFELHQADAVLAAYLPLNYQLY